MEEEKNKKLLRLEYYLLTGMLILILVFCYIVQDISNMFEFICLFLIIIVSVVICAICIYIEQKIGYYECKKCGNRYVPSYAKVLFAMHINRTRYMKCPECNERSWQRKVLTKEKKYYE